jgi:predicted RNase H-like HicB family nuclease
LRLSQPHSSSQFYQFIFIAHKPDLLISSAAVLLRLALVAPSVFPPQYISLLLSPLTSARSYVVSLFHSGLTECRQPFDGFPGFSFGKIFARNSWVILFRLIPAVWYDYNKEQAMFINFTAKYTKIPSGYLGQLVEWPEVVTEGKDLEDCRAMLRDALQEMILAYRQQGKEIPPGNALIEQLPVEIADVRQTA